MEAIKKEAFEKWAKKHDWMQFNDIVSPTGRQISYITPSGSMVFVTYDLKGNLFTIAQPVPIPQSPLDFSGKKLRQGE